MIADSQSDLNRIQLCRSMLRRSLGRGSVLVNLLVTSTHLG